MKIEDMENFQTFFAVSDDGKTYNGFYSENCYPSDHVDGYKGFHLRGSDYDSSKITTIENYVCVNNCGMVFIKTDQAPTIPDDGYIHLKSVSLNGIFYHETPQIFKEFSDEEKKVITDEEYAIINKYSKDINVKMDSSFNWIPIQLNDCTRESAFRIVDELNNLNDNWYVGDPYEEYFE